MRSILFTGFLALALATGFGCSNDQPFPTKALRADKTITGASSLPLAVDPGMVGEYPTAAKSGAGIFFDQVLEYRVWLHPEKGAKPLAGNHDYFLAFAKYERALALSQKAKGAEEPLALIRQYEWIDEPSPGKYEVKRGERVTEWQPAWLKGSKREPHSIAEFLAKPRKSRH